MISKEDYLQAKEIVEKYEEQLRVADDIIEFVKKMKIKYGGE